jgi:ssDNA-binding Zn-finger/Zn-ribbon topoisomerase 1
VRVEAVLTKWGSGSPNAGQVERVAYGPLTTRCDEMKVAIEDEYVGVGGMEDRWKPPAAVNIYKCYAYPEGAFWENMAIERCPWCGEPIEIVTRDDEESVEDRGRRQEEERLARLEVEARRLREKLGRPSRS